MADNTRLNVGVDGDLIATDEIGGVKHQYVKIEYGADDSATPVSAANPLPITVAAPVAVTQSGTWDEVGINDSGNAITVDWNGTAPPIGGGLEATALKVTIASDSTGVLSVDDNGGSLTVDVGTALPAGTNNIGDVDVVSLPALAAGTNNIGDVDILTVPAPLSTTGGGTEATALRVTLASDSTGLVSVDDNGGSLTIDNAALSVTGGGVEASALRVTIASDSTGVLSVDDNGGSLTIDNAALSVTGDGPVTSAQRVVIADMNAGEYETVAASQTAQVLGTTGGTGDWISGVLVVPASTSPGNVLLLDNATSITVFAGGASSVSNLVPFFIPLGMKSVSGAWKITTGASVSCIGIGNFT